MQTSVIRSAISEDSPRQREEWSHQEELMMEVERLRRRNALLQKSKMVLQEELQLNREELESKNRKIEQLSLKLTHSTHSTVPSANSHVAPAHDHHLQIILLQQQEQLGVLSDALKDQSSRVADLQQENDQLRAELLERNAMVRQLKDSSRAQLNYQRSQIDALQQEIQQKSKEMAALRLLTDNLTQKEGAKWTKVIDSLREKVKLLEQEKQSILAKDANQAEQRQQLKDKNGQLSQQIQALNERVLFLQGLLEEAKGQFINVHLQQQQHLEKQQREKRQYRKRNQLLKTQLKCLKLDSSSSTAEPSNKSTRTSSTISVTPFRTASTSTRSKPLIDHD